MFKAKVGLGVLVAAAALSVTSPGCVNKASSGHNLENKVESYNLVSPVYELRVKNPNLKRIVQILTDVEKVPDSFQKIGNDYGATVVIYEGILTDNKCMSYWKGKQAHKKRKV